MLQKRDSNIPRFFTLLGGSTYGNREQKELSSFADFFRFTLVMILTFQTSFPTVDEEERYADIDVPATRRVDDVRFM